MRLTQKTFDTLKEFESINNSVVIRPGNVLETVAPQKTLLCFSTVREHFPVEFGISNLDHFLKLIKRMSEGRSDTEGVELEFQEEDDDNENAIIMDPPHAANGVVVDM